MPSFQFSTDQDVWDQEIPWRARVLRAAVPHPVCGIIMAVLARAPRLADAYGETADIWPDGRVATMVRRRGVWGDKPEVIGTIVAVRDNVRRLADHCKLSDRERLELFAELGKWIRRDFRAQSGVKAGM